MNDLEAARIREAGQAARRLPNWAIIGAFILLIIHTLVWAASFLIPITAGILGYLVLSSPRRRLTRMGIPSGIVAILFTGVIFLALLLGISRFAQPISEFLDDLPRIVTQMKIQLGESGGLLSTLNEASTAITDLAKGGEEGEEALEVEVVSGPGTLSEIASRTPSLLGQTIFAVVLLFFLISSGDLFLVQTVRSFDRFRDKRRSLEVIHEIERRLGAYLGAITLINAGLGIATGLAMWAWGLPNPVLFGLMGFVFNYVPFVGAIAGATLAGFVGFVTHGTLLAGGGVFATYMALTSFEGQFITPALVARRLKLNTTVVFVSVAFFAWIWSVMGMVFAVPLLIVTKIICDEMEPLRNFGRFLGDEGGVPEDDPEFRRVSAIVESQTRPPEV